MPKKKKSIEDHLQAVEFLLAGVILKKDADIKHVAKIIGCSDKALTALYPDKRRKNKGNGKKQE